MKPAHFFAPFGSGSCATLSVLTAIGGGMATAFFWAFCSAGFGVWWYLDQS